MKNKLPIIILFGDPGAGKGTQAEILAKKLGYERISTGDLIRSEMKVGSFLSKKLAPSYNVGKPAPNAIVNQLVENKIIKLLKNKDLKGIVSDTFPFDNEQSDFLKSISKKYNLDQPIIFWIDVPENEILKRLGTRLICSKCNKVYMESDIGAEKECQKCGGKLEKRTDDSEEVIKKRILIYKKAEAEHRAYYKNHKLWFDINGKQSIESVAAEIWSHLKPILS
jgi:adenylate kinase